MSVNVIQMENNATGDQEESKRAVESVGSSEEDKEHETREEHSAIDTMDIAQLKVELETAREEARIRIDELQREIQEVDYPKGSFSTLLDKSVFHH